MEILTSQFKAIKAAAEDNVASLIIISAMLFTSGLFTGLTVAFMLCSEGLI